MFELKDPPLNIRALRFLLKLYCQSVIANHISRDINLNKGLTGAAQKAVREHFLLWTCAN